MSTLHDYVDRKRLKWMGFYLSEHTAQMDRNFREEHTVIKGKTDMTSQEIAEIMKEALLKDKAVAIQTNELVNYSYLPDVIGKIKGHNEEGVFVGESFITYGIIKHIEFFQNHKWSEID